MTAASSVCVCVCVCVCVRVCAWSTASSDFESIAAKSMGSVCVIVCVVGRGAIVIVLVRDEHTDTQTHTHTDTHTDTYTQTHTQTHTTDNDSEAGPPRQSQRHEPVCVRVYA